MKEKECLWYNGQWGYYELLDFDPNELTKEEIINKAWEILKKKYTFEEENKRKVLETLYLLDINNLESIGKGE